MVNTSHYYRYCAIVDDYHSFLKNVFLRVLGDDSELLRNILIYRLYKKRNMTLAHCNSCIILTDLLKPYSIVPCKKINLHTTN